MLIPGPKSPGMNIDVYLQPLIDELKDLWEKGALTWDAKVRKIFTLRAVLLWTINDFPAYAIATWVIIAFYHRTIDGAGIKVASTTR